MLQKKNSKNLILFLCLVSILFSGMFFNHAETDGYFRNSPITHPVIKVCDETILMPTQLCPETMVRSQISSYVQNLKKESFRSASMSLPVLPSPTHTISYFIYCLFEENDCLIRLSNHRIICYIHNQDGAKS